MTDRVNRIGVETSRMSSGNRNFMVRLLVNIVNPASLSATNIIKPNLMSSYFPVTAMRTVPSARSANYLHCVNRDSSVGTPTTLRDGQPTNRDWIPGESMRRFLYPEFETGSGAH